MAPVYEHPLRYTLVNELHARPYPKIGVPAHVVYAAFKEPNDAANRDRAHDFAHLCDLLTRKGAPNMPSEGVTHFTGHIGRHKLKWESHTEFVTYLAHAPGYSSVPFDPLETSVFPNDWIAEAPGGRVAAIHIRIETLPDDPEDIAPLLADWFVAESLVCSSILEGAAVIAGDFRLDAAGQMRFAVFVRKDTGAGRIGRIVQRICEIETYRAVSMLGLDRARSLMKRLNLLEPQLSELVEAMSRAEIEPEGTLHQLLAISGELEALAVQHSFRFGATGAYEAIMRERVAVLREARFHGRQLLSEFMTRRYDPAVRTVHSAEKRLSAMLERAARAAELLRTRVDVERSAQNQSLLESMDRRADLQLRLQHTVEGLSVVAISYYAVSLAGYLLYPLAKQLGASKEIVLAGATPAVIFGVWLMIRKIRKGMGGH
ncbi:DUF3422 domain-containing protein [Thioclava sp. A2]|uniref:DUF3422 family protein n=1 Tax=Thioclava sp. FCG-A2 TaxID=3080562 RepID=UPI0029550CB0|nr:DUF3422 domain-containing protein [Thioclava sp. A2]MDV7269422.1 DUF3422 domain-containing protein [Thioclava sp. A2]